jgi:LytS/YehU family sensor histidine kinase
MYFYASESVLKEKQLREIQMEKFEADQLRIKNELENSILREKELISHKERLQLEYAFLRAQINPHFLHNTLNVLFSQALDSSPSLPDNILKLSKLMRYAIESLENENGCVSIEKEVEHLKTLLEIHQLRVGKEQVISFEVNGGFQGQLLPPLSVITIVENAFKYGDLSDSAHPLKIVLSLTSTRVTFLCSNKKSSQSLIIPSNNIGMTNLRKRLDVVFKGRYNMNIIDDSKFFTFEMSIDQ